MNDRGSTTRRLRTIARPSASIPKEAEAYSGRAVVYGRKGEHDKAIADYNQAIRLDPKYTLAYYNRGVVYAIKGEYDKAIADYAETHTPRSQ